MKEMVETLPLADFHHVNIYFRGVRGYADLLEPFDELGILDAFTILGALDHGWLGGYVSLGFFLCDGTVLRGRIGFFDRLLLLGCRFAIKLCWC